MTININDPVKLKECLFEYMKRYESERQEKYEIFHKYRDIIDKIHRGVYVVSDKEILYDNL
jgi:hypothetical protein